MAKGRLARALTNERVRAKGEEKLKRLVEHNKLKGKKGNKTGDKSGSLEHGKKWIPFKRGERLLLLGEADFSFTRCIVEQKLGCKIVATNYDSEETILAKYSTAEDNIEFLHAKNGEKVGDESEGDEKDIDLEFSDDEGEVFDIEILHDIDATKLTSAKSLKNKVFDAIIFNFPHVGKSIKDQDRNIMENQKLVVGFFNSARDLLSPRGRIIITIFEGEPYKLWNVKGLAKAAHLQTTRSGVFQWNDFPGYRHSLTAKEGHTSKVQATRAARMYELEIKRGGEKRKRNEESDSE